MKPEDWALERLILGREWRRIIRGTPDYKTSSPDAGPSPEPATSHGSPHVRAKRLDAWADRQPDPHPDDSWAEIASAAKAARFAEGAILVQASRGCPVAYVPWDGAGGEYELIVSTLKVSDRDRYYLREHAEGLEMFARQVLGGE